MNWDDFRYFLSVTKNQTLKKASGELRVDQATVGRRLTALQENLGVKILEKRSNGYFLTAAGERIFSSVQAAEEAMCAIHRLAAGKDERVEGVVKLAMPGALANQWLLKKINPLMEKHPGLQLDFLTGPEVLNLSRREADVAIRLVRPTQKELKTKKVGQLQLALYKLKEKNKKISVSDLEHSPFVGLFDQATSESERNFLKTLKFTPQYRLRSSAWSSVYAAVRAGLGVGILPTFIGDADPELQVLEVDSQTTVLWLVVHPEVAQIARVRVVIDFLTALFSNSFAD